MKERAFFRCELCGNIVEVVVDGAGELICCNKPMVWLKAGAVDAAVEKHVPTYQKDGNKVCVQVGSVEHPMTEEHYIQWIQINEPKKTKRVMLSPTDVPKAEFCVSGDDFSVYAYCNLHGLWKA